MNTAAASPSSSNRYRAASERAAAEIIRAYSTSFGVATRILGDRHRTHVRNIYALVRVADELVDGVAAEAGLSPEQQADRLDALERETEHGMHSGYSSNPIVHAFAGSARLAGIDRTLTAPFFASMRMDLRTPQHSSADIDREHRSLIGFDQKAHAEYVYGSAEVVGLMCLRVFTRDEHYSDADIEALEHGARSLGAAFQNINFMRDLADDTERLSRNYLSDGRVIDEELKLRWLDTIRQQLREAEQVLPLLPGDARVGVDCAYRLFAKLTDRLAHTPAEHLLRTRVRVANLTKAGLIGRSIIAARLSHAPRPSVSTRKVDGT